MNLVNRECVRCGIAMEVDPRRRTKRCVPCRVDEHRDLVRNAMQRKRARAKMIKGLEQAGYSYVIKVGRGGSLTRLT